MASKLSAVLSVVFAVSFMLVSVVPFVAASSLFYRTYEGRGIGKAFSVVQTGDGGYALIGYTQNTSDYSSVCWLVKTDSAGNMEWNKTFEDGSANSIVQTGDGGYVLAGSTSSFGAGGSDFWLVKTDSFGNMAWNTTYRVVGDPYPNSIVQTSDGGYALAGGPDYWLVKTDPSGNTEWNKTYTLSRKGDWCNCMIQTKDGTYLLAGTKSYNLMALIKTNSSGDMEWNQTYEYGDANSVIQTSDGGYAMAGYKIEGFPTFCLVKTDEAGIIPEFPSWIILPLLITATLLIIICKQKLHKTANRQSY